MKNFTQEEKELILKSIEIIQREFGEIPYTILKSKTAYHPSDFVPKFYVTINEQTVLNVSLDWKADQDKFVQIVS